MRINEEIRAREVRVIAGEGEQLGIMSGRDALQLAQERHLDLVEIAPTAKPPVCRIMDYGKYRDGMRVQFPNFSGFCDNSFCRRACFNQDF